MHVGNFKNNILKRKRFHGVIFFIPVIITCILSLSVNEYYLKILKVKTQNEYSKALSSIGGTLNNSFYELSQAEMLLSSSSVLKDILYSDNKINTTEFYKVLDIANLLTTFRTTKQFIDNVYIFHKPDNLIISSNGTAPGDMFFDKIYNYDTLDNNYWRSLSANKKDFFEPKTYIVKNSITDRSAKVIPIVQFGVGQSESNDMFVININESYISNILKQNKLTPNSELFVLNKNKNILSQTSDESKFINGKTFPIDINTETSSISVTKINNKKSIIIVQSFNNIYFEKMTYVAIVPYSDLLKESTTTNTLPIIIVSISLTIGIFTLFFINKKIYKPIGKLTSFFGQSFNIINKTASFDDELDFLNSEIKNIINKNKKLETDLSVALPYVCEQYLFKILNNNELYLEEEIASFLSKYGFSFKYDCFIVAITNLDFTQNFNESFGNEEHIKIYQKIHELIKTIFPIDYQSYIFTVEKERMCTIINIPDRNCGQNIIEAMEYFHNNLNIDKELLCIYSGIGKAHENLSGLQQSYKEALKAISSLSAAKGELVKVYEPEEGKLSFLYSVDEENKLFNYLLKGDRENITLLIDSIIKTNLSNNISESYMKRLYCQLYNTSLRALNVRKVSPSDLMGEQYVDIMQETGTLSLKVIKEYFTLLLDKIIEISSNSNSKIDLPSIREFIDSNFDKDIYLEQLADKYNVTAKYMSKLLKQALGLPFYQYLSILRINKAKELLLNSEKSINSIYSIVGFNNRNTFIRMFKKLEGITPSEYRTVSKMKEGKSYPI
jgi:AraC-like DNA-binding protein